MSDVLLVHYSEIGTKGQNRSFFERRLRDAIHQRLFPDHVTGVRVESGRIVATLAPQYRPEIIRTALDQIFGVAWFALARRIDWSIDAIESAVLEEGRKHPQAKTFKVFCRRADKTFPMSSDAVARRIGKSVVDRLNLKVDLDHHDLALHVEILPGMACVFSEKSQGLRGMPKGSSGRMLCLFSGGIDSPVAAWVMMRRGALVNLLHFHPFRKASDLQDTKIFRLHKILRSYNPNSRLYLVPHYHYQVKAALEIPMAYEMVLFRRFIFRAAQELARRRHMQALITGDSLGQVASQTVENIAAAQYGLTMPIFLPLIAQDKEEIIRTAQRIGTYDVSNEAYKDCCSLMSKHPKTMVGVDRILRIEEKLGFEQLIDESLNSMEVWDGETLREEKWVKKEKLTVS
jgi:thiamine biosynthesis protein ThiI